jgi:hypothetical protein
VLYLQAEKAGLRGTGIGCFFDDEFHQLIGLKSQELQDVYHFTIGDPVIDDRLQTLPPYLHLETDNALQSRQDQQRMQQLKQQIAQVFAEREQLKQALENGSVKPSAGFSRLDAIDLALSRLDSEFKTLWDQTQGNS